MCEVVNPVLTVMRNWVQTVRVYPKDIHAHLRKIISKLTSTSTHNTSGWIEMLANHVGDRDPGATYAALKHPFS